MIKKFDKKKNKKSQIAYFIIFSFIILIILVFLLNYDFENKEQNNQNSKINNNLNFEVIDLKSRVDSCVKKNLEEGLFIAGFRGGFIYDSLENYYTGFISQIYPINFLQNFNQLNLEFAQSKILSWSEFEILIPGINYNNFFEHNLNLDLEKYVFSKFLDCLDFENLENIYQIDYNNYQGILKSNIKENNLYKIFDIDAKLGDELVIFNQKNDFYKATVLEVNSNNYVLANFSFDADFQMDNILGIKVFNLNNSFNITFDFQPEKIIAKTTFPITIKDNKKNNYEFLSSQIQVDSRYKLLRILAKELLESKEKNRTINYFKKENFEKLINQSSKRDYFLKYNNLNLTLKIKNIIDSKEHKRRIYTLIDNNFKLFGFPYSLNFGYENKAPYVNFSMIANSKKIIDLKDNQIITLIAIKDNLIEYNLKKYLREFQKNDFPNVYFIEKNLSSLESEFKIFKNGTLSFLPKKNKLYRYLIEVCDGETCSEQIVEFIVGIPNNENNLDIKNCLHFENFADTENKFPIEPVLKNKINYKKTGSNKLTSYAYQLSSLLKNAPFNANLKKSQIRFARNCLYDDSLFLAKVTFKSDDFGIIEKEFNFLDKNSYFSNYIEVPFSKDEIEIKVNVLLKEKNKNLLKEPYFLTVYPVSCLGPFPKNQNFKQNLGGYFTCCDFSRIVENQYEQNFNLKNSPSKINNLINDNSDAINTKVFLFFDPLNFDDLNYNEFDYSQNKIWGINNKITSLFKANLKSTCNGFAANPFYNLENFDKGNHFLGKIKEFRIDSKTTLFSNSNLKLNIEKEANLCEFSYVLNKSGFSILLDNGLEMNLAFANFNKEFYSTYVGPIFGSSNPNPIAQILWQKYFEHYQRVEYDKLTILCDKNWYLKRNGDWNFFKNLGSNFEIGLGNNPTDSNLELSYGYCTSENNLCKGNSKASSYNFITDHVSGCVDNYFKVNNQNVLIKSKPAPSFWQCSLTNFCNGSNYLCNN